MFQHANIITTVFIIYCLRSVKRKKKKNTQFFLFLQSYNIILSGSHSLRTTYSVTAWGTCESSESICTCTSRKRNRFLWQHGHVFMHRCHRKHVTVMHAANSTLPLAEVTFLHHYMTLVFSRMNHCCSYFFLPIVSLYAVFIHNEQ